MRISQESKELIEQVRTLPDAELIRNLKFAVEREKHNLRNLLAHILEYDGRRLARKDGYPSTYHYCVGVLGYDEGEAYRRVNAARVCRDYPGVLDSIQSGELSLTSLLVLSPELKLSRDPERLLADAKGKSKRELESYLVAAAPRPGLPDSLRRFASETLVVALPASASSEQGGPAPESESPGALSLIDANSAARASVDGARPAWQALVPVSLERVRIGFDAGTALVALLERARQILRHKYPEGRFEDILREALEALLERRDPQRKLSLRAARIHEEGEAAPAILPEAAERPISGSGLARANGRYIPAKVKDAVWRRDDGRCAWRFEDGIVCGSRDFLEYDHIVPFARGGRSDNPRNIRLLCRMHNALAAERAGLARPGAGRGPLSAGA